MRFIQSWAKKKKKKGILLTKFPPLCSPKPSFLLGLIFLYFFSRERRQILFFLHYCFCKKNFNLYFHCIQQCFRFPLLRGVVIGFETKLPSLSFFFFFHLNLNSISVKGIFKVWRKKYVLFFFLFFFLSLYMNLLKTAKITKFSVGRKFMFIGFIWWQFFSLVLLLSLWLQKKKTTKNWKQEKKIFENKQQWQKKVKIQ